MYSVLQNKTDKKLSILALMKLTSKPPTYDFGFQISDLRLDSVAINRKS